MAAGLPGWLGAGLVLSLGLALKALAGEPGAAPAAHASAPAPALVPADSARAPVVVPPEDRAKGLPFGPGESLRFSIEYGIIKAGTAWLEVLPMEAYRGRTCFHLVSRAESNGWLGEPICASPLS